MDELGTVLLVGEPGAVPGMVEALTAAGYAVTSARPAEVPAGDAPDAVVLDAACTPAERADVVDRLGGGLPVLVATAGEPALVEPHLSAGVDAVLPPFLPPLLRARVESARELVRLVANSATSAQEAEQARIEKELQIGRDIQAGFLPRTLPQPEGWDIAARFRPAREVAGDFYDAFEMVNGRRVGFVVADVCDKGVGAALFMALIRTLVRSGAQQNVSMGWMDDAGGGPGKDWLSGDATTRRKALPSIGTGPLLNAVAGASKYMTDNHLEQGYFATMFFGMIDPKDGTLLYVNGGHNPPAIVRADGTRQDLPPTGPAVGMLPGVQFRIGEARLERGDTLFAYTDGIPEAKDEEGHFFGEPRMYALLEEPVGSSAGLLDRVDAGLHAFVRGAVPFDDITMMAVRRLPAGET